MAYWRRLRTGVDAVDSYTEQININIYVYVCMYDFALIISMLGTY